jgi:hypothetical protein
MLSLLGLSCIRDASTPAPARNASVYAFRQNEEARRSSPGFTGMCALRRRQRRTPAFCLLGVQTSLIQVDGHPDGH